jgi:hypothetical protein
MAVNPHPGLPPERGKEQIRVLDSQEREWRDGHSSVKFELMTFMQTLRTNVH